MTTIQSLRSDVRTDFILEAPTQSLSDMAITYYRGGGTYCNENATVTDIAWEYVNETVSQFLNEGVIGSIFGAILKVIQTLINFVLGIIKKIAELFSSLLGGGSGGGSSGGGGGSSSSGSDSSSGSGSGGSSDTDQKKKEEDELLARKILLRELSKNITRIKYNEAKQNFDALKKRLESSIKAATDKDLEKTIELYEAEMKSLSDKSKSIDSELDKAHENLKSATTEDEMQKYSTSIGELDGDNKVTALALEFYSNAIKMVQLELDARRREAERVQSNEKYEKRIAAIKEKRNLTYFEYDNVSSTKLIEQAVNSALSTSANIFEDAYILATDNRDMAGNTLSRIISNASCVGDPNSNGKDIMRYEKSYNEYKQKDLEKLKELAAKIKDVDIDEDTLRDKLGIRYDSNNVLENCNPLFKKQSETYGLFTNIQEIEKKSRFTNPKRTCDDFITRTGYKDILTNLKLLQTKIKKDSEMEVWDKITQIRSDYHYKNMSQSDMQKFTAADIDKYKSTAYLKDLPVVYKTAKNCQLTASKFIVNVFTKVVKLFCTAIKSAWAFNRKAFDEAQTTQRTVKNEFDIKNPEGES